MRKLVVSLGLLNYFKQQYNIAEGNKIQLRNLQSQVFETCKISIVSTTFYGYDSSRFITAHPITPFRSDWY